jgi:hypothetical protein
LIDTLFFVIQITGLVVIGFWAYRNDRRLSLAGQDGLLAVIVPEGMRDEDQPDEGQGRRGPETMATRRTAPVRRRFIS